MSSSAIEEHKIEDLGYRPVVEDNGPQDDRVVNEIIDIIESSDEKEHLLYVLRDLVVPTQGIQVMNLINSIANDITGSQLEEEDKTLLNTEFSKFKGLLPDGGNWIDLKASGGALPRYRLIQTGFFEAESRKRLRREQEIKNQRENLSAEIVQIQQNIERTAKEKEALVQSLQLDSEIGSKQNQILEKGLNEIQLLHRIHQEEKNQVLKSNEDFHLENSQLADNLKKITTESNDFQGRCSQLVNETKKHRESHFSNSRKIAAKKKNIESMNNLEGQLKSVQEELKRYSNKVKEGEQTLEKLKAELAVQVSEYGKYATELNNQLQSQEIASLKGQLQQEIAKAEEMKQRNTVTSEESKHFKENLQRVKDQAAALDLDNSLQKSRAGVQRVEEVLTKNIQSKQELKSNSDKQKESIAKLEKEIKILLENDLIEEQSIQILQQESAEKSQLLERDTLDFKLYQKNSLSAKRSLDEQIQHCDWKRADKTHTFANSFIRTLVVTILCSLFCIILYNLPSGTLSQLFDI